MGKIRKRSKTLSGIFLRYVIAMLGELLLFTIMILGVSNILMNRGYIYPANYTEKKILESYDVIANAEEVTEELIPPLCNYGIFSVEGELLGGNLSSEGIENARKVINGQETKGSYYYKEITRPEEYVVIQYSLSIQYSSKFLREHFIAPGTLIVMVAILGAVAIILLPSLRFGKKIKYSMKPMLDAVDSIKNHDLDYETADSGVKEFDDCLNSIDEMRTALKDSLEKQWNAEQEKSRQISALAHDIKTPLTVARGNAELLMETELTEEQKGYANYISNSASQIQNYVQTLIEVTKSVEGYQYNFEEISLKELLNDVKNQTIGLAEIYHLQVNWHEQYFSETMKAVYDQVVRAVLNIVKNAAEHTDADGTINVSVEEHDSELVFTVEDTGCGFTKEALLHGTEQFFMGDSSRSGGTHYGIGLFSAKSIAVRHGGNVLLSNSEEYSGAKVQISFLVCAQ